MAQINAGRVRFVSRGEYSNSTEYFIFDLVNYNGSSYIAKENTVGVLPTDTSKWQLIAQKGNTGNDGPQGLTGNGISSVEVVAETSSEKTLRINFTDGTHFDFTLENGEVTQAQLDEVIERDNRILANTPKGSTNTNPATMNDSADLPLNKFVLKGKTEQESTTGKNLFQLVTQTISGVTLTANEDGSYTVNGTATSGGSFYVELPTPIPAGTYTISYTSNAELSSDNLNIRTRTSDSAVINSMSVTSTSKSLTATNTSAISILQLQFFNGKTYNNFKIYIQLESGSTATEFEKYTRSEYQVQVHHIHKR